MIKTNGPRVAVFEVHDFDTHAAQGGGNGAHSDCLSEINLNGLWEIIFDKKIEKVMHSCSQDIEIFFLNKGGIPENIFDTQIAAAFIGYSSQVGFKELLEQELSVKIEKSQTRSDWSKRPLAKEQLEYAFDDVEDLIELADSIKEKLISLNRNEWVFEECYDLCLLYTSPSPRA